MQLNEVTLKSSAWKIPRRLDKQVAEVIAITTKGNLRVRIPGQKTVRIVDPQTDIYEKIIL